MAVSMVGSRAAIIVLRQVSNDNQQAYWKQRAFSVCCSIKELCLLVFSHRMPNFATFHNSCLILDVFRESLTDALPPIPFQGSPQNERVQWCVSQPSPQVG